jgi:hypothetical protein
MSRKRATMTSKSGDSKEEATDVADMIADAFNNPNLISTETKSGDTSTYETR